MALLAFQPFWIVPVDECRDDADVDILVGAEWTVDILPTANNLKCNEFHGKTRINSQGSPANFDDDEVGVTWG